MSEWPDSTKAVSGVPGAIQFIKLDTSVVIVDVVEAATNIDFYAVLPDDIEVLFEASVDISLVSFLEFSSSGIDMSLNEIRDSGDAMEST